MGRTPQAGGGELTPSFEKRVTADEETEALCTLTMENGDVSGLSLVVSKLVPAPHRNYIDFMGESGFIHLPYSRGDVDTLCVGKGSGEPDLIPLAEADRTPGDHCLYDMMGACVDACLGRTPPPAPGGRVATFHDGHAVQQVLDAITEAAQLGTSVRVV